MKFELVKKTEYVVDFGTFGTEIYDNLKDAEARILKYAESYGKPIGYIFEQTVWYPQSVIQNTGYRVQYRTVKDVEWQNWTKTFSSSKEEALTAYQTGVDFKVCQKNAQLRFEVVKSFSDGTTKSSYEVVD